MLYPSKSPVPSMLVAPHSPFRRRRAFSLIELISALAIIALLTAIIIAAYSRVRESAANSHCTSNLRQINLSLSLYIADNDGYLPAASRPKLDHETGGGSTITWGKALKNYLPLQGTTDTARENTLFVCPAANYNGRTGSELGSTYAATAAMIGPNPNTGSYPSTAQTPRPLHTIDPDRRSEIPLIVEGKPNSPGDTSTRSNLTWANITPDQSSSDPAHTTRTDFRHRRGMNTAYADGSVRPLSFEDFRNIDQRTWEGRPPL